MGSGHRSGRPEGRTAPPHEAPGNRHGGGQDRRAQQQRAEPTGRAARRRSTTQPMSQPVTKNRPSRSTSADSPTAAGPWCLQSGRARGGFAGPPCPPRIAQEPSRCATSSWDHWRDAGSQSPRPTYACRWHLVSGWCWLLHDMRTSGEYAAGTPASRRHVPARISLGTVKLTGIHSFSTRNQFWQGRKNQRLSRHVNQWNLRKIS